MEGSLPGMTHAGGTGWAGGELVGDALGEVSPHPAGLAPEHERVSGVGSAESTHIGPAAEYRLLQGMGIKRG